MHTYYSIWGIKLSLPLDAAPVIPGHEFTITTKAGKVKTETVQHVLSVSEEHGQRVYVCTVMPKEKASAK